MKRLKAWWRAWQDRRTLKRWSRMPVSEAAKAKAAAIQAALLARQPICRHCFSPYTVHKREFAEYFRVRAILMIPDREPELMLCDACIEAVAAVYNPRATVPGTSNSGPSNLLLQ